MRRQGRHEQEAARAVSQGRQDKPMVINKTNQTPWSAPFGKAPANWINASADIYVGADVMFGGAAPEGFACACSARSVTARKEPEPPPPPQQEGRHERRNPVVNSQGRGGVQPPRLS